MLKNIVLHIAKEEGYELDKDGAELLAVLADGSYRDGLGELQKVLNFSEKNDKNKKAKKITREDVEKITGAPKTELVNDFIKAIALKDLEKGITTVEMATELNLDIKLYLKLIIQKFRMAIILRYAPKLEEMMALDLSDADIDFLKKLVKEDKDGMLRSPALSILLEAYQNMDNAFIAGLPLELALVKIVGKE